MSPRNITVLPTNASAVVISWIPPPVEDRNGIIQGYTIRVVGVHTEEDFTLGATTTETMIGGLHPFYSYKFTVATVTISHGPFSNPVTVMMPPLGQQNFTFALITYLSLLPLLLLQLSSHIL